MCIRRYREAAPVIRRTGAVPTLVIGPGILGVHLNRRSDDALVTVNRDYSEQD